MIKGEIAKISAEFIIGFLPGALANIGSTALDLTSLPTNPLKDARNNAIEQTLTAFEKNREFGVETLQAAKTLLENPPPLTDFIPDDTAELLRTNQFEEVLTQRLVAQIASGSAETDRLLSLTFSSAIRSCMKTDAFRQATHFDVSTATLQGTHRLEEGNAEINAKLEALLRQNDAQAEAAELAERLHVTEKFVLALAHKYAEDAPTDMEGALASLRRALEIAADERAKGRMPSNTSDAVDAVMARVDELNDEGRIEDAQAELRDAIATSAAREEAERATRLRLIDRAIAQAILANDPEGVAEWEEAKAILSRNDTYDMLFNTVTEYHKIGHDTGATLHLQSAVSLAQRGMLLAPNDKTRGACLNQLGTTWAILGTRGGKHGLLKAIETFRKALQFRKRDRYPTDWSATQNNLGNAFSQLAEELAEDEQEDVLDQAVEAYRLSLEVRPRETAPNDWAVTQTNLGSALLRRGALGDTKALNDAIEAFQNALEVPRRDRPPHSWAMTQNSLGGAYYTLGAQGDPDGFRRAIEAFESALEVRTRDRLPMAWAGTKNNIAVCYEALAGAEPDDARNHLKAALSAINETLEVYEPLSVPRYANMSNETRTRILAAIESLPKA